MDRRKASKEIAELLVKVVNRYNALERCPVSMEAGGKKLHHAERQMIDVIGAHPAMNVTAFAEATGVTKGAVSQAIKKLEVKGVVRRLKRSGNDKEVLIELTPAGEQVFLKHRETNEETLQPLVRELERHSDEKVEFLVRMLKWFDWYLGLSREMKAGQGR